MLQYTLKSSKCLLSSGFPTKTLHTSFFPIHATRPTHFIVHDLTTLVTFGEGFKSRNNSVCRFLNPALTSSLLDPNIFLSILPSNTISLCSCFHVRDKFHTHTKQQENYSSVYHPKWPNERNTLKTLSSKEIIALQIRNSEQIYLLWGWIQDSKKHIGLKREQAGRTPSTTLLLQVHNHYFHFSCGVTYHTLVFRVVCPPCHGSGDREIHQSH